MSTLKTELDRLTQARNEARARRQAIIDRAEREGRKDLTESESTAFTTLTDDIKVLDERVGEAAAELRRSGYGNPEVDAVRFGTSAAPGAGDGDTAWARTAAEALRSNLGGNESRAVISGSVDVPALIPIGVTPIARPQRILDLLVNRQMIESMAYEAYVQTARVNAAAPVADLQQKPVSTLTVEAVQDRARVFAHLSEPIPFRIWQNNEAITNWLNDEMSQGVLDAVEHAAISGDGSGEMPTGVLHASGVTAVPYTTDLPTTLRSAVTALQTIGEQATGWVMNPVDSQSVDLLRWGAQGGLLVGGYEDSGPTAQSLLSDNIFGPTRPRVVSPSVPAGTAILADWRQLKLFVFQTMQLLANAFGDSLFQKNAVQLRAEMLTGINVLRPKAFAVVDLTP